MVKRSKAMRRADCDALALRLGKAAQGKDRLDNPSKSIYATVQTVRYQSDGVHMKSRYEPKSDKAKRLWSRD